jgi:hypothetical protein
MSENNKSFFSFDTFFKRATDAINITSNRFEESLPEKNVIKASDNSNDIKSNIEDEALIYLRKQSLKVDKGNDQRKLIYEYSRTALYYDYLAMDGYPTLGAALDLLSEEATTTKSDTGQILNIYCSSDNVKKELENLFYVVLDVNTNLFHWCRNMCQFGDNFLLLEVSKNHGIVDIRQLAQQYVERNEKYDEKGRYRAFFKYRDPNIGSEDNYLDFQIAHFRLLGSGERLPYGSSILEKVRRTYKQLFMMEDAMMIYRITRAAERRVYKVPVGNVPPQDIPQIVQKYANTVKKKRLVDPKTGDINWKFNIATMDEDIFMADRGTNSGQLIDTLPGANNLDAISDITYLRDNLFVGLGIHKTLLGFSTDQTSGDGKNLSMLDIRFARKVNRIQQALLAELNKIAIIHLGLLGGDYLSYINDFKLSLNNPSTASDLLQLEIWKTKFEVYQQATAPNPNTGIKPMSELMSKKRFFNMSEEDIINDLQEQMIEAKIGDEIKGAGMLLKSSGLMDKMIKYKNAGFNLENNKNTEQNQIDNSLNTDFMGSPSTMGSLGSTMPSSTVNDNTPGLQDNASGGLPPAGFLSEEIQKKIDDLDKILKS